MILRHNPFDVFTNGCHHDILKLCQANIDFQFVLDEYSTIMYVCGYMMKSEKAMGDLLRNVSRECSSEPVTQQLKKNGKVFIGKQVVCAPEAAMRIISRWLTKKSQKVQYVNSNVRDDRVSLPKSAPIR